MSPDAGTRIESGRAPVGELEIAFDVAGDPADPALLLVPGLGTQRIYWDDPLVEMFTARGFRVIRIDNRDAGESTVLSHLGTPARVPMMLGIPTGLRYTMSDMAADAVGVLDHLGIDRAHLAGFSMGGMIVQTIAVEHPDRVLSMCSIMSRTGRFSDSLPGGHQLVALLRTAPTELDAFLTHTEALGSVIGSAAFPQDEERLRRIATEAFNRGIHPDGTSRQLHAINAQRDRSRALRKSSVPTLVIHGAADRLVFPRGGRHTAKVTPGARLRVYDGMAHDLPEQLWPRFADEIASNAARAGA
ncbi:MAG: alpha/beta fold hydrolase [Actinomycetota bacterium]|nr:alpha/beta fold hydrolase [Actinomycetota bacterium]